MAPVRPCKKCLANKIVTQKKGLRTMKQNPNPAKPNKSSLKPNGPKKPQPSQADHAQQRIAELTNSLQLLQAEFENFKKRQNEEQMATMLRAKEMVLSEILPALDNFDLASTHLPSELEGNSWAQGMVYVGQQLTQKLDELGIKKLNPINQAFDHHIHEAIEHVQSDKPEGIITEVITPGYQIGDRVVRPARVKVSGGTNPATQ
ncbi:nucleotide exchange factor GrpE [Patescibacteria group bacterium]|nr:nucleotide exchange factor GrpE [Patescibacteria group bacterium]